MVSDLHYFSGRGAKDIVPLYRTSNTFQANIVPGLLEILATEFNREVLLEDWLAYLFGNMAQLEYTAHFARELENRQLRAPITKSAELFAKVCEAGMRLMWLHTYGERFIPESEKRGSIPYGKAKCTVKVPEGVEAYLDSFSLDRETCKLHVGQGEFQPISPEILDFEVSGFKVVQSWLGYRMKSGKRKGSSPLDVIRPLSWTSRFTTELLELLWVLEATLESYPEQSMLFHTVISGDCFRSEEMPPVPLRSRKAPPVEAGQKKLVQ